MLVKVSSVAFLGIETIDVTVEVNVANRGFPAFDIVGLPAKSVAESRERVRTAIINSGFEFPAKRITVNLAPADLPKDGTFYDLSIAVGILAGINEINVERNSMFFGELSLNGELNPTKGTLLACLHAEKSGHGKIFVPEASVDEILINSGPKVFPVKTLRELVEGLKAGSIKRGFVPAGVISGRSANKDTVTIDDIISQAKAKRALEIAAVGKHNILMVGPPGAGKTMLANAFASLLTPLSHTELIESAKIYSSCGNLSQNHNLLAGRRPFRFPHHSCSYAGFIGGGMSNPTVGEISLAHNGVLFMDEFPEFSRPIIESLRQPLEEKIIRISRKNYSVDFPANFILIAAMNPCPCGFYNSGVKECVCFPSQIRNYRGKVSGPIVDRIDLFVEVSAVGNAELVRSSMPNKPKINESSKVYSRILAARNFKENRTSELKVLEKLNPESLKFLKSSISKLHLSARSYFKVLRVSRTIADLEQSKEILPRHIAEALQYRKSD